MIAEAEIRRLAARAAVDPMVQDLDYGLGWFLAGLFSHSTVARALVFKGGTCLRKCYFADYRFSEDLDFTLIRASQPQELARALESIARWSADAGGPDFAAAPSRLEILSDDYGRESLQARVYYRGPLRWRGEPRSIQLDITREEYLAFPTRRRALHHPYSDAPMLPAMRIVSYDLPEMLAEKVRAIGGQRRFAISRDLYDIHRLMQEGVSWEAVRQALPGKLSCKGLDWHPLTPEKLRRRESEFAADWERHLTHLLPSSAALPFQVAWQTALRLVTDLQQGSPEAGSAPNG